MKNILGKYCFVFILFTCLGCSNNENEKIDISIKQSIVDSSLFYADDIIDDSLLQILDDLQVDTLTLYKNIQLDNNISVGDYSDIMDLMKQLEFSVSSVQEVKDSFDMSIHLKEIEYTEVKDKSISNKVFKYYFDLDSSQRKWNDLIISLTKEAFYFTTKTNFTFHELQSNQPKQNGLAYAWGIKDYSKRLIPTKNDSVDLQGKKKVKDSCSYQIYGLDCSGFFSILFSRCGIELIPGNAEAQRQVGYLKKQLQHYFGNNKFEVEDLGHISVLENRTGDIVYKYDSSSKRAIHIGLVLLGTDGKVRFCESHGKPGDCIGNLQRGPTMSYIDKLNNISFRTVRIIPKN